MLRSRIKRVLAELDQESKVTWERWYESVKTTPHTRLLYEATTIDFAIRKLRRALELEDPDTSQDLGSIHEE